MPFFHEAKRYSSMRGECVTPLNGADLPFDVLNEQLVGPRSAWPPQARSRRFQFRLLLALLVIHAMERHLIPTLADWLDQ